MLTNVLTVDPARFGGLLRQQPENHWGHDAEGAFKLPRMATSWLGMAAITRVPMLDWPADLFADAREIAA